MGLLHEKEVFKALAGVYSRGPMHRYDLEPFKTLVSCVISLRTKDEVMFEASRRLFGFADSADKLAMAKEERIAKAIYPAGFYNVKARQLKRIAGIILEEYEGRVPDGIDELLKLPGVGRKTANIVVCYGYGKEAIPVDTHVHRICNRLGWVRTNEPDETELRLREKLSRSLWRDINWLMVRHGQEICNGVSPICSRCVIGEYCKRVGVGRSR